MSVSTELLLIFNVVVFHEYSEGDTEYNNLGCYSSRSRGQPHKLSTLEQFRIERFFVL